MDVNRPDLHALGSQPVVMPRNLPDHCSGEGADVGCEMQKHK